MKHKVLTWVTVEKTGLFGFKRKVRELKTVEVDDATYRKMLARQKEQQEKEELEKKKKKTMSVDEMMLIDDIIFDDM